MKKRLSYKDFPVCVPWKHLEAVMGKREYNRFMKWMRGQTCLEEGVYPEDLDRYLRGLPVID